MADCTPRKLVLTFEATGSPEQIEKAMEYLRSLGYDPVKVEDVPKGEPL